MNIIVVGGGASGLTAAIRAAENGAKVTLLEKNNKIGEKIKITGNGQCNVTNMQMSSDYFYSNKEFLDLVLNEFDADKAISFFENIGLYMSCNNNYIYPRSKQASSVVNALRERALILGVKIKTNNKVNTIKASEDGFVVDIGIELKCDRLIIATGGLAAPKTGSDGDGYSFAKALGHNVTELKPALTALICRDSNINKASGVRCDCDISVFKDNRLIKKEYGQLQITDYGISGIPVFNISHLISDNTYIELDFLSEYSREDIENILKSNYSLSIKNLLCGLLRDKLVDFILKEINIAGNIKCSELSPEQTNDLINQCKKYIIVNLKRRDYEFAQVTQGGVSLEEINPSTMESKIVDGLYFCGEVLDVDGICGGYNLQFAWSSGYIAGENSSK